MNKLVAFKDSSNSNSETHYGILTGNKTIICLCCLGTVEEGEYEIVEEDIDMYNSTIDSILKEELYDYDQMEDEYEEEDEDDD